MSQFGAQGLVLPICVDSFAASLDRAAMMINSLLSPPCIPLPVQLDATQQPDCNATSHTVLQAGTVTDKVVPACADSGGAAPCWQLSPGGAGCEGGKVVDVSPDPNLPPTAATNVTISCALCDPNMPDFDKGCP